MERSDSQCKFVLVVRLTRLVGYLGGWLSVRHSGQLRQQAILQFFLVQEAVLLQGEPRDAAVNCDT